MQHGRVDLCIVGTDRTTATGDVANKIGTYFKALAAHDNGVPFYVALPSPTIDWSIERRRARSRSRSATRAKSPRSPAGPKRDGARGAGSTPDGSPAANSAFDVTPARLVTGAYHRARRLRGHARGPLRPLPRAAPARRGLDETDQPMTNWSETYRGTVPPWECDVTEHFTIAYYFDRLEEAERNLAEHLGLGELLRGGGFARHLDVRGSRAAARRQQLSYRQRRAGGR